MEKLNLINYLLTEIQDEKNLLKFYDEDEKQAKAKAEEARKTGGKPYAYSWTYKKYKGRKPSKSRIQENCKKARQLLLEISREI